MSIRLPGSLLIIPNLQAQGADVGQPAIQAGLRRVRLAPEIISSAVRQWPLLRPLLAIGAGYASRQKVRVDSTHLRDSEALMVYCLKGDGWCDTGGKLQRVQAGDAVILPGGIAAACAPHAGQPWTVLWVEAGGEALPEYFRELGAVHAPQVLRLGEDPQFIRLFNDVFRSLESGCTLPKLLQGSHALGALLALAIEARRQAPAQSQDIARKIAAVITYMSEHVDEHLSVSSLAGLANLSPAYFGSVFRAHTGSAPRDYLHLLRIHRACQMLQATAMNVKEIAASLGYQDQFHFSRQFKAFQGMSPTHYRDQRGWRTAV